MLDTLISNVTAVTMNERMDVLFGAYIGITDGKISYIDKKPPQEKPASIIDGTGMVAMPGLVNCHTHLATTVLRYLYDDASRREALETQLNKEARLDSRSAKAAALLGIAECLRFGITSVSDLYYYPEATAQAAAESGIKANIALSSYRFIDENEDFDFQTDEQCALVRSVADKWHGYDDGRICIDAGFYAEYTSNYKLWQALSDYAKQKGLRMQLHLAQTKEEAESCEARTGLTPAELLSCHGVFDVPATAAGCAALTELEQKLLAKKKTCAVVTPIADAKAGMENAPVLQLVKNGMNVALGTGGASECGSLDMFEQMRAAACAQRVRGGDSSCMPAQAALLMATVCGAIAQGRIGTAGMLKIGMDADIAMVDFSAPHLIPCHNVISALVFGAKGGDVAMTMVRGKVLYHNGQFPTIDLNHQVQELTSHAFARLFDDRKE